MTCTPGELNSGEVRANEQSQPPEKEPGSEAGTQTPSDSPELEEVLGAELEAWLRHFGVC